MNKRILIINPGSTSTKIAIYDEDHLVFSNSISHSAKELAKFDDVVSQYQMRKGSIIESLAEEGISLDSISLIMARGGLLPPLSSGAYKVNEDMVYTLTYEPQIEHASNLGAIIAHSLAKEIGVDSYIYDPVTVDEMEPIARITGLPEMERKSMGHNLNMRASALRYAQASGRDYKELTLLVVHMGGGITLSLHHGARMIDMITDDEGPFSPERAGGLPGYQLLEMATKPQAKLGEIMKKIRSRGGLNAYFGTTDAREVEELIQDGDKRAALVYEAMAHNIAKNIGKLSVVVGGKIDAIILTGGIAHSKMLTDWIKDRVSFIAPLVIYPGENEMEALAQGALRVMEGKEKAKIYKR